MKHSIFSLISFLILSCCVVHGQQQLQAPPFQKDDDRAKLRLQSGELFDVLSPITQKAGKSAVWIWFGEKKLLATGTVIGKGDRVLTKWSEIANYKDQNIQCVNSSGRSFKAIVLTVYEDEDIAVLQIEKGTLPALSFTKSANPDLGSFLIAAGPGDNPLALGVVSVNERSLRVSDQAFVGVSVKNTEEGNGVEVESVSKKSPADQAGLKVGDVIRKIDDSVINDTTEFRSIIAKLKPEQIVKCTIFRQDKEETFSLTLAAKSSENQMMMRQNEVMERMGGEISKVRDGFPAIIQSDMVLNPEECGAPVFDIDGRAVGLVIARSGRVRSYVISSSKIEEMLATSGVEPSLAKVRQPERPPVLARNRAVLPRLNRGQMDNMRSRMQEMRKFMRQLDAEILELDR